MARLGVIVSRDCDDLTALKTALDKNLETGPDGTRGAGLMLISAYPPALDWAAGNGIQHEEAPADKVVALSDSILAIGTEGDEEVAAAVRRARAEGKPVETVQVGEGAAPL